MRWKDTVLRGLQDSELSLEEAIVVPQTTRSGDCLCWRNVINVFCRHFYAQEGNNILGGYIMGCINLTSKGFLWLV